MAHIQNVSRVTPKRDTLMVMLMLSLITSAGMFAADILPVLISALRDGLGFSGKDAGLIGASNVYGATFGGVLALFVPRKLSWRKVVSLSLAALVLIDLVSTAATSFTTLVTLRFVHGLIGGISVGIGFGVIARTAAPDRTFGVLMLVQYVIVGLSVMLLPQLIAPLGAGAAFLGLAVISMAALVMLPFVPDFPEVEVVKGERTSFRFTAPIILTLLTIFIFQTTKMSLYSYLFGLGRSLDLSITFLSTTLGIAAWVGSIGAWAVVVAGLRYGRLKPLVIMMLVAMCAYGAILVAGNKPVVFALALGCIAIAWSFIAPYLFGMCTAFDASGRSATWSSFLSMLGMATGPALGGIVLAETHYDHVLGLAITGMVLCIVTVFGPAMVSDQKQQQQAI